MAAGEVEVVTSTQGRELRALQVSLGLTSLLAAGALVVALLSDSETMTLEAMSGIADVVVSLVAIFVARKVHAPC
jgi:hypothetical protein